MGQDYRVLLVSATEKLQETMLGTVPELKELTMRTVASVSNAQRELLEQSYDLIIINSPLPDAFGTRFAIDAVRRPGSVVLMLLRGDVFEEVSAKLLPQGVFTLSRPVSAQALRESLRWMFTVRERLRILEKKTSTVEEKMEEIRLVNRAKWLLIEQLKMTEPEAHRYIEKQAMDRCVTRREIAQGIIRTYT